MSLPTSAISGVPQPPPATSAAPAAAPEKTFWQSVETFLFGDDGFDLGDLVDIVNPLQHIPVIGSLYRQATGDEIGGAARFVGSGLFGGVVGMVASSATMALEAGTGRGADDLVLAVFNPSSTPDAASDSPPAVSVAAAPRPPGDDPRPADPVTDDPAALQVAATQAALQPAARQLAAAPPSVAGDPASASTRWDPAAVAQRLEAERDAARAALIKAAEQGEDRRSAAATPTPAPPALGAWFAPKMIEALDKYRAFDAGAV